MKRGLSVVRDSTGLNQKVRRTDILQARKFGHTSVALLASSLSIQELRRRNATRDRKVPDDILVLFLTKANALTVQGLRDEGFDTVVVWNDRTAFTLN